MSFSTRVAKTPINLYNFIVIYVIEENMKID